MCCRIKSTQEGTLKKFSRFKKRYVYSAMFSNNKWMGNIYEMKYLFMYKATGEGNNQQEENE